MRVLIVDDEPIARKILCEEAGLMPGVTATEEAGDGATALLCIREWKPDIVLLDLQMPVMGGFDVIRQIDSSPMPVIVVVTAWDQHAIQAFDAGAIDYLLKPVSSERLATALARAARMAGRPAEVAEQVAVLQNVAAGRPGLPPRKIVGRIGDEYFLLSPDEVFAFQAEDSMVWIVTLKRRYQATATLKVLQEKLAGLHFQRVHRNALVNVTHVRKLAALSSQRWLLTLQNNQEFIVSKRQARSVRDILSW